MPRAHWKEEADLLRKNIRISKWFLAGVLIYAAFISILYFRMKNAEKMLADYYDARFCESSSNCREIIKTKILNYGSKKVSFTNYGAKGLPLESGTFEEYLFTLSRENSEVETVKVLPNTPADLSKFDVSKIYIPTKSDALLVSSNLFDGKSVFVEVWRNHITLILTSPTATDLDQANESPSQGSVSIGPLKQEPYEMVLPTENHPVILAELSKNDFNGWTGGLLVAAIFLPVFGGIVIGFIYGIDWVFRKIRRNSKNTIEMAN